MKAINRRKAVAFLAGVMVLLTAAMAHAAPMPNGTSGSKAVAPQGMEALPEEGRYAVSAAIGQDQPGYHAQMDGAALVVDNTGNGLSVRFVTGGVEIDTGGQGFSLRPMQWGYGDALTELAPGWPQALGNIVTLQRGPVSEWYVNGPLGLQQGFTVAEAPQAGSGPLRIAMTIEGALVGSVDEDGRGVMLTGVDGTGYRYSGLVVRDAHGREAHAWLEAQGTMLHICTDDTGLSYPLYIDPIIQKAKLTASDGWVGDAFGYSIAISGDTVVVGAPFADIEGKVNQGVAYVFVNSGGSMMQAAKLTASDGMENDFFGNSVAISGDTVVVGAPAVIITLFAPPSTSPGTAYVFVKPSGGWAGNLTETARLTATFSAVGDAFGLTVAMEGDTVFASGFDEESTAVYVFVKPIGGWSGNLAETARLKASEPAFAFGYSIAISDDTVVVTGVGGAAYVFTKPSDGWTGTLTEQARLTASDGSLGYSVAISGDTVVAGTDGYAAYVFVKPPGGWASTLTEAARLNVSDCSGDACNYFGLSVAVSGDTVFVGASRYQVYNLNGAVYVYTKPSGGWADNLTETAMLTASDAIENQHDLFGYYLAISGGTLVVGAPQASGDNPIQGAVYVFKIFTVGPSHAGTVPDTGQTQCYNNSGNIPCPSSGDFYGQDGSYSINRPSYTKLDATGNALPDNATLWAMVRDNVTGLIWEYKTNNGSIHDNDNSYTWYDNNSATNGGDAGKPGDGTDTQDFINALNVANFGGYSDWRLPTPAEFVSIAHYESYEPAINTTIFGTTKYSGMFCSDWFNCGYYSSFYSTSATVADHSSFAWTLDFQYGSLGYNNKPPHGPDWYWYARAVRGGQSGSVNHFVINGNLTVTDNSTGLMWERATAPGTYNWKEALAYCDNLTLAGYSDWRLPTVKELQSIADYSRYNPAIDNATFPYTLADSYWSSTSDYYSKSMAWIVNFSRGIMTRLNKGGSSHFFVRAVRGGAVATLDYIISGRVTDANGTGMGGVTMLLSGAATGSVTTDADGYYRFTGLAGPEDCTYIYTVTPTLSDESFKPASRQFEMPGNVSGADFAQAFKLTSVMSLPYAGHITSADTHIDCPGTCSAVYDPDTIVTLTATSESLFNFDGWDGGGCSGTGTCTVTMDAAKTVTANFSCIYSLDSSSVSGGREGFDGSFNVATGEEDCTWTASRSDPWISINSGANGAGSGTVQFSVARNDGTARSGTITVNGLDFTEIFTVYQDARMTDDGSGTITDITTGLEWFKDANYLGQGRSWANALDTVEGFNDGEGMYGHNDWRLPTIDELAGMQGVGETFSDVPSGEYWSSTTRTSEGDAYAWRFDFDTSSRGYLRKDLSMSVWPVRSGSQSRYKTLNAVKAGQGSGMIRSLAQSSKIEVLCDPVCFTAFDNKTQVTLEAVPDEARRMTFEGWGSDNCDSIREDNACIVTMNRVREVVAYFGDPYGANLTHKAIIVAGSGPYTENNLWNTTKDLVDDVYDVLLSQGYTDEKIYYLAFETNGWPTGSDNESGSLKLEHAIKGWAADADTLVIYLMGHGLPGEFEINGLTHDYLQAESLRQWLDELQTGKKISVIVVYEGCYSGSFLPLLTPGEGLEDAVRIVITSASADEKAWFAMLGDVSFSQYFWSGVQDGQTVDMCFQSGFEVMNGPGYQTALMDADADAVSDSYDLDIASRYVIGRGMVNAGSAQVTGNITGNQWLTTGTSAMIAMTNISPTPSLVWSVIRRPSDGAQTDARAITRDVITLSPQGTSDCSFADNNFTESGVYTVSVYALVGSKISRPWVTHVIKNTDSFEDDDAAQDASPIVVNSGLMQYHNFDSGGDIDWVKFYGMAGDAGMQLYAILADEVGTCERRVELYGPNDPTLFITDNVTRLLGWECRSDGMYYIKIYPAEGITCSNQNGYELKVYNPDAPVLGIIKGSIKDTGGSPILNAVITTDYGYSALGSNGSYEMPHKGGGPFTLKAEAEGYQQYSQSDIHLTDRETLQLNIVMTPIGGGTTTTVPGGDGETTTTTTATGGGSTTTTTTIRRLCPARKALGDESETELEALRIFRDKRLNQSAEGAKLVSMYYRHAAELTLMFERRPDIAAQVRELVLELLPQLGGQQKLVLSNDMKQQMFDLIDQIRTDASPGLKKSLRQVRKNIEKGELELK